MSLDEELIANLAVLEEMGDFDPESTGTQARRLLVQWLRDTGLHNDIADAFEKVARLPESTGISTDKSGDDATAVSINSGSEKRMTEVTGKDQRTENSQPSHYFALITHDPFLLVDVWSTEHETQLIEIKTSEVVQVSGYPQIYPYQNPFRGVISVE